MRIPNPNPNPNPIRIGIGIAIPMRKLDSTAARKRTQTQRPSQTGCRPEIPRDFEPFARALSVVRKRKRERK